MEKEGVKVLPEPSNTPSQREWWPSFWWDLSGRFGAQLITVSVSIIVARYLGPADYGMASLCLMVISFLDYAAIGGLGAALVQHQHLKPVHYHSSFIFQTGTGILLNMLIWFAAPWVADWMGQPKLQLYLRVFSLSMVVTSFRIVQESILTKELAFKQISQIKMTATFSSGVAGVLLAANGMGVWSLLIQVMLYRLIHALLITWKVRWRPQWQFSWKALRQLWRFGGGMFGAGLIHLTFEHLDSLIIARLFSPVEVGLFNRAKSLNRLAVKYSAESLNAVLFPTLAKWQAQPAKLIKLGLQAEKMTSMLAFGLLGLLYVIAYPLIILLLGQAWAPSVDYFKILCLSGFAIPIGSSSISMLKASGHAKSLFQLEVIKKSLLLAGFWIGFSFGLEGYLYSLAVSGLLSLLVTFIYTERALQLSFWHQCAGSLPFAIPALIAAGVSQLLPYTADLVWSCLRNGSFFAALFIASVHFSGLFRFSRQRLFLIKQI